METEKGRFVVVGAEVNFFFVLPLPSPRNRRCKEKKKNKRGKKSVEEKRSKRSFYFFFFCFDGDDFEGESYWPKKGFGKQRRETEKFGKRERLKKEGIERCRRSRETPTRS